MKQALIVGAGGFVGCIARYLVGLLVVRLLGSTPVFPYATLAVNVAGCFLIGLLGGLAGTAKLAPDLQLLLITGMLGGLTTYSTFGFQAVTLVREHHTSTALFFLATHLVLGLGAVWLGLWLVRGR